MLDRLNISTKLAIVYTAIMSVFLFVFCSATLYFFRLSLLEEFDHSLRERFAYLDRHLEQNSSGGIFFRGSSQPNLLIIKGVNAEAYVEVWDKSGHRLFQNSEMNLTGSTEDILQSIHSQGMNLRMIAKTGSKGFLIKAAFDVNRIISRVDNLLWLFLWMVPPGIFAIACINFGFSRRALAPIREIIRRAKLIDSHNLSSRIAGTGNLDELGELTGVLNSLFYRVEKSFESLKRFTADASHELRTPLTAIRASCEVILEKNRPNRQEYKETINSILEESSRMTDLVETLLMLARGDSGGFKVQKKEICLISMAKETAGLLDVLAEERNQTLQTSGSKLLIRTDPTLIRQAFMGILYNAIRFSPAQSTIQIRLKTDGRSARLSIEDDGPGIPEEHQTKIFERFYKVEVSRGSDKGGFGLGLPIAKWICELLDGHLHYEARSPNGSIFSITLPLEEPEEQP